jgi:uncharacterized membrane protein
LSLRRTVTASVLIGFLLLLGVAVIACGPEQQAGTETPSPTELDSGIQGIVLLGPVCPTDSGESPSPCLTPYVANLVITDTDGNVVTRVTSGADGRFEVLVPPGDYVIQPDNGPDGNPSSIPQPVTVAPDEFEEVEVDYDTGLR